MNLYYHNKDILTLSNATILHQVNCQKRMASGLALAIRRKYPEVYVHYLETDPELGTYIVDKVPNGNTIISIYGQEYYGYDGKQYTSYEALARAFHNIAKYHSKVVHTNKIGCIRGGGDWEVVKELLTVFDEVNIYEL